MPLPETAQKMSRILARDEVYEKLRSWIIDGTLQPEEILQDQVIGAKLGVSRTPVREALRRLEDEGLVETALNRWTRVAPLDLTKTAETYAILEALEELAVELAFPSFHEEDIAQLRDANSAMQKASKRREPAVALMADEAFHEVLIRCSKNGELLALVKQLKIKLRRVELAYFDTSSRTDQSFREHVAIIQTLEERSLPSLRKALRSNWAGSLERLRRAVEKKSSGSTGS
jgi:DNA-binding GntR family transcriptional regulator